MKTLFPQRFKKNPFKDYKDYRELDIKININRVENVSFFLIFENPGAPFLKNRKSKAYCWSKMKIFENSENKIFPKP